MSELTIAIAAVKTLILLLGGGITYIAVKAYRRTGEKSLRALSIGFGIVTLGAVISGVANQMLSASLAMGVFIDSLFVAFGLAVILYSLYVQ
ncbi:MAG: heme/copper-type cytochrome/quinol oxidase subunit 3 [Natronomonas sp.]|jgi:heme/copper-type cytochrome/quinol oxidase subunit 3